MRKERKQILLVDDDVIIDFLHKKILKQAGINSSIETVYNGKLALQKLVDYNNSFNESDSVLVLLDLNMPVLDGWGFLKEFEQLKTILNYDVDIFILSSSTNSNDISRSKSNPFVRVYLKKPLSLDAVTTNF
jgi:CheY-like chemotaxis protein